MTTQSDTLPELIDQLSGRYADRIALIDGERHLSFGELGDRTRRLSAGLRVAGVGPGDVVLIWMVNRRSWLEVFLAAARLGAVSFALNTRLRAVELADVFERTQARAVVFEHRFRRIEFGAIIDEASRRAAVSPQLRLVCGDVQNGPVTPLSALLDHDPDTDTEAPDPAAAAVMFATSGSTAAPKFVVHSHRSIVRHARHVAGDFGMSDDSAVMLQALPYCGVFGFCQALAALAAARPSVILETFDAAAAVAAIQRHSVTHFNTSDDMLDGLVAAAASPADLASLRLVGAASFGRGPEHLAQLARSHELPVVGLYGMSEVQALFARRALDDAPKCRFAGGGRPASTASRVRIRNPDTGEIAEPGVSGEIELKGDGQFTEYYRDNDATGRAITPDGYVRTGDLGFIEPDGAFTYETRMGDSLRLGGFLVNPDEIADFISALDGIAACQVVGVSVNDRLRAAAFVRLDPGAVLDTDAVLAACEKGLAAFKVPVLVHALEAFPTVDGPNGTKIRRTELRTLAEELIEN